MSNDDPQNPLEHQPYPDERAQRRSHIIEFLKGMVRGIIWVVIIGFVDGVLWATSFDHVARTATFPFSASEYIFALSAVATALLAFLAFRAQRRRFFLAGLFLGISIACIIEGLCFYVG